MKRYVVMSMQPWSAIDVSSNHPLIGIQSLAEPAPKWGQPCGFLPVFDTYEEAREWAGNDTTLIAPIQEVSRNAEAK